jgi:23S rRNA-intervening sequence protein
MARTEHLPIYKAAYDLCLYLDQVVRGFPRYHKYSLGADLRAAARRALRLVVRGNSRREKSPVLLELLREELEELKVLLRLSPSCPETWPTPLCQ